MNNILFTPFGGTWQIVPELLEFTNPEFLNLYRNHSSSRQIEKTRKDYKISPVDEIWLGTTIGEKANNSLETLNKWYNLAVKKPAH
jgi:adenosine deaminase